MLIVFAVLPPIPFKTRSRDKVGRAGPTPLRIIAYFQSVSGERRFPLCQKRRGAAATELEEDPRVARGFEGAHGSAN